MNLLFLAVTGCDLKLDRVGFKDGYVCYESFPGKGLGES